MNNYVRALRNTLQYPWTVAGTFVFSLRVAVVWGGNIGALYPVIQVAFQGKSLQVWMQEEIDKSRAQVARIEEQLQRVDASGAGRANGPAEASAQGLVAAPGNRKSLQFDLDAERRVLGTRLAIQPWIERYLPHDPFRTVALIVGSLVFATMIKGIFLYANAMCVSRLEQRLTFDLRRQLFGKALRMDLSQLGDERTSGLLSRCHSDIGFLTSGVKNLYGTGVREPLKMLSCLIGASFISWRLLAFSLVLTPLVALLIRKLAGSIKRANRRVLDEISQLYSVMAETFDGLQTVQAYTLERRERQRFHQISKECMRKSERIGFYSALTKPLTETMGIAVISLALLAGAYLTLNQATHLLGVRLSDRPLDLPSLLVFYGLLIGTTEPARKLSEVFNSIQAGVAAADRLYPLLDAPDTIVSPSRPRTLARPHRELEWDNVSYHYSAEAPVLQQVRVKVRFGETIAIVGPNGCGKSTFVNLLPRFFDPVEGTVRIDGVDVRELRVKDLRRRIGMVSQHASLFDDTVYNNILCGRLDATPEEVRAAAEKARAHRFITEKLADGYETRVGAGGNRLSGGQRQRVALARAILRDPEVLILDEATSQIDLESEQLIHQALEEFAEGRTVFMITHRLSTLTLADRILVMNHGCIEDFGSHADLMGRCELYQRLYSLHLQTPDLDGSADLGTRAA
jgi:ATP-binding cassette subfamily B protein/subfamily B ATP-binding cassette protein MsbA